MFSFDRADITFDSDTVFFTGAAPVQGLCRSDDEIAASLAALRPRGDAWRHGGHDGLAGVMAAFFTALGASFGATNRRFCALIDEFFCATARETRDLWALEHGLPDGCDPFLDVCEKVNAVGDTVPAYAVAAARRRGWAIAIRQEFITRVQASQPGLGRVGTLILGARQGVAWHVTVDRALSRSYLASGRGQPLMGRLRMGRPFACAPDLDPLICLLRRIAPAHADLSVSAIN